MQVIQSFNSYTVSLFSGATSGGKASPAGVSPGPASYFAPAAQTEMTGVYTDPGVAQVVGPAILSDSTQRILDTIHSLANNEMKTIGATFRQMAEVDLQRVPENNLPESARYTDLTYGEKQKLSDETRDAGFLELKLSIYSKLATQGAAGLKGTGSFLFGEKYVNMTDAELVAYQINALVDRQIESIEKTIEMSQNEDFVILSDGTPDPTGQVAAMTEEERTTLRDDLLAQRMAEYERGALHVNVTVFASTHAANYDKTYKTLNMASGETVVNAANTAVFDEAWELSERNKEFFQKLLVGDSDHVRDNIELLGIYAEEYIKDATS